MQEKKLFSFNRIAIVNRVIYRKEILPDRIVFGAYGKDF